MMVSKNTLFYPRDALILGTNIQWENSEQLNIKKYSLGWKQQSANERQSIIMLYNNSFILLRKCMLWVLLTCVGTQ